MMPGFSVRRLIFNGAGAFITALLLLLFFNRSEGGWPLFDAVFMTGLVFLCAGAFRLTRSLGFYDTLILTYRKIFKPRTPKLYNEEETEPTPKKHYFIEPLCVGFALILVYLVHLLF